MRNEDEDKQGWAVKAELIDVDRRAKDRIGDRIESLLPLRNGEDSLVVVVGPRNIAAHGPEKPLLSRRWDLSREVRDGLGFGGREGAACRRQRADEIAGAAVARLSQDGNRSKCAHKCISRRATMKLPVNRLNAVMLVVAGATGACAAAGDTGVDDGSDIQSLASASIESCDQVVRPGESIQAALDRAAEGSTVYVEPGVYRETANALNGLTITRGVHLIGRARFGQKVVLENSGAQANGIVVVPPDHTDCMSCHSSLASPFPLRAGVVRASTAEEHVIRDLEIQGITIRNFTANGIFTRSVDGFRIDNVHSVNNPEYGVFPILSKNGTISRSSATGANDTGFWVETSENVDVIGNLAEGNVAGFQVSNSDNVRFIDNIARKNSIGVATFLLPNIFAVKSDTQRITIKNNRIYDNNRPNTANSILAAVPSGTGILHLGADDSRIVGNDVRNNDFAGIGVADYCIVAEGTRFGCSEPHVTPEFIAESEATKNMIGWNTLVDNGKNPDPSHPFAFAASDLALITSGDHGNCYTGNNFGTSFSTIGGLPACP